MQYILYHASVESFDKFKEEKMSQNETDLLCNGFWFSSSEETSCAWRNPKYLKTCRIVLNNPVSYDKMKEVYKELGGAFYCSCNDLRLKLIELGYDGFIMNDIPNIDKNYFNANDEFEYIAPKGAKYRLRKTNCEGWLDLFFVNEFNNEEYLADFENVEDFLKSQEIVVCVFSDNSIEILKEERNYYWK